MLTNLSPDETHALLKDRKALLIDVRGETKHLAGGIAAWKQAGLAVITLDPATGAVIDPSA